MSETVTPKTSTVDSVKQGVGAGGRPPPRARPQDHGQRPHRRVHQRHREHSRRHGQRDARRAEPDPRPLRARRGHAGRGADHGVQAHDGRGDRIDGAHRRRRARVDPEPTSARRCWSASRCSSALVQLLLGLLRAGSLVRFVSNSVMRGFLTGVAVNIVLSQVGDVTGYKSDAANKVLRLVDTVLHPGPLSVPTLLVSALTIAVILGSRAHARRAISPSLSRWWWRQLSSTSPRSRVPVVGDSSPIPSALPKLVLPEPGSMTGMLVPAVSVAIVGLIQGAGISKAVPNPDGTYPSMNRDFVGQGVGNAAAAVFGGMPMGGSLSSTALTVQLGDGIASPTSSSARSSRSSCCCWRPAVETIPVAALAAMLVLIGCESGRRPGDQGGLDHEPPHPGHHAGDVRRHARGPGPVRGADRRGALGRAVRLQLVHRHQGGGADAGMPRADSLRRSRPRRCPTGRSPCSTCTAACSTRGRTSSTGSCPTR